MIYNFIITDKKFEVENEGDLETLFKLYQPSKLSSIIHWNIIMEIDEGLIDIIKTYNGLLKCLKYLNEKNTFLLLIKISDILQKLISSSNQLGELLSKLPDDSNKIRLLKRLRIQYLNLIIKDANDLGNIFEWLYGYSQSEFIEYIGNDFIKKVFLSTNEIIMILHFLNDKNKDKIINIIGLKNLKNKVKTSKNFLTMFSGLTDKTAKKFINLFSKLDIKNLFKSEDDFYNFMLRLPKNKEKIFLKHLGF